MKNGTLRNIACGAVAIGASLVFSGCGGSGNTTSSVAASRSEGKAQITIYWPPRTSTNSRLIPLAANSVVVQFVTQDGKTVVASQTLVRPGDSGTTIPSTASFVDIPQGTYNVKATAYPSTDGSGVAQATATSSTVISAGLTTPLGLTMATTIASIDITPHNVILNGTPVTLTATAYDANNNVVLSSAWSWADTNQNVVTMSASGATATVNAIAVGTATVTATETDSGKSGQVAFTVGGQ